MNRYPGSWFVVVSLLMAFIRPVFAQDTVHTQDTWRSWSGDNNGQGRTPPWELLDQARELHLTGETGAALMILEEIANDTLLADEGFSNARRELTAYVLSAMGQHERAFDTLRVYAISRIAMLDQENEEARVRMEARIHQLDEELERETMGTAATLSEQRSEARDHLLIAAGIIVLLLIIIVILALRPRKEEVSPESMAREPVPATVVEQPTLAPGPATPVAPGIPTSPSAAPLINAEPMDAAIMQDHIVRISNELNMGGTIEAAGHLGMLLRFLRMVTGQVKNGHMPAQDAVAFIRQYLKLEAHRTGSKVRYSVDADRKLVDGAKPIPAMELVKLLAGIMPEASRSDGLTVELVPSDVGEGGQCLIKYPRDQTAGSGDEVAAAIARTGLEVDLQQTDDECRIRVEWPDARG